ncbi:MAG: hypothetical protein AAGK01_06815 [Pseudomonadota bacterium]
MYLLLYAQQQNAAATEKSPSCGRRHSNASFGAQVQQESSAITQMMAVDFTRTPWLRAAMDEDSAELARQLYTRIGMAMEDASVIALELGAPRSSFDLIKIQKLDKAADTIVQLTKAARSIVE